MELLDIDSSCRTLDDRSYSLSVERQVLVYHKPRAMTGSRDTIILRIGSVSSIVLTQLTRLTQYRPAAF